MKQTSVLQNGLVWFGAGVSVAEIMTGIYFAPLGFYRGITAILLGHLIGGCLFFCAGLIGAKTRKSAMGTVEQSFGRYGCRFFAALNVLQLVGWTSIMIYDGADACESVLHASPIVWSIAIGALILLWIALGIRSLGWLNRIAMGALFVLTVIVCVVVFQTTGNPQSSGEALTFGAAVELAAAMPLSWLPLVSDYTREAERPLAATLASTLVYNAVSIWMYLIGLGAALFTKESNIAAVMVKAGLGLAALLILVLSTVTTTFLDAYSAGISAESLQSKVPGKTVALGVTVLGTLLACLFNMDNITEFLYLIGSVFAPMAAILIADFFVLKRTTPYPRLDPVNAILWAAGFALYRCLLTVDTPVGNTLPCMLAVGLLAIAVRKILPQKA